MEATLQNGDGQAQTTGPSVDGDPGPRIRGEGGGHRFQESLSRPPLPLLDPNIWSQDLEVTERELGRAVQRLSSRNTAPRFVSSLPFSAGDGSQGGGSGVSNKS
jgi:hypothetical protein